MDNRSREELIVWLTQIIDNELNKSDDQTDMDLILECSDYLDELQKEKNFYKEQDILQKIAIIKQRVENSAKNEEPVRIIRTKRRVPLYKKILIAVAAALLIAVSALAVVAHVQNYESTWRFIEDHIYHIKHMSTRETFEENNMTITKSEGMIWYSDMEEMLATENINILYPTKLPTTIKSIHKSQFANNHYRITILLYETTIQIIIDDNYLSDYSKWTTAEVYTYNNMKFYILIRNDIYFASCQYNGYEYTITSDTRDSLIEIIQNLKEYKP